MCVCRGACSNRTSRSRACAMCRWRRADLADAKGDQGPANPQPQRAGIAFSRHGSCGPLPPGSVGTRHIVGERDPTAIVWRVAPPWINPVYAEIIGIAVRQSPVIELDWLIPPLSTDMNSSRAVAREIFAIGIVATCQHTTANILEPVSSHPMGTNRSSNKGPGCAATTLDGPSPQTAAILDGQVSACAAAHPLGSW